MKRWTIAVLVVMLFGTGCSFLPDVAWETLPQETSGITAAVLETEETETETEWHVEHISVTAEPDTTETTETEPAAVVGMTEERAQSLAGQAYYWAPSGTKIHTTPYCSSFRGTVYAGTLTEAESVKDGGFCKRCKTAEQSAEDIMQCHTYEEYMASAE